MSNDFCKTGSQHIVITGAGLATSLGLSRATTWQNVCAGRSGIGPLTALEQTPQPNKGGGQAPDLPADFAGALPREARYLQHALNEALQDAQLDKNHLPYPSHRCGLVMGTTLHGMRAAGHYFREQDFKFFEHFLAPKTLNMATEQIDLQGLAITTCSACASGLGSIALAITLLCNDELDMVITGGYDTISEYAYAGFNSLGLVANGLAKSFCMEREGLKLGEGYGVLVLERATDAKDRNVSPIARCLGYGESADAYHLTHPHPEGEGAAMAMSAALQDANLDPKDVDLICAHATSTPDNDHSEFKALKKTFGEHLRQTPVVALKNHLGHTLGGAGAVELILATMAMRDSMIPATANIHPEELEFEDLCLVFGKPQTADIRAVLINSFGFGGSNVCMIIGSPNGATCEGISVPHMMTSKQNNEVMITGVGIVVPGALGNDAFRELISSDSPMVACDTGTIADEQMAELLSKARRVRRMSEYVKLSLAATSLAVDDAQIQTASDDAPHCTAILGTCFPSATYSSDYYREVVEKGIDAANPMLFAEGVPNAAAAHLSLMLGIKGGCQSIIGSRTAGLDALRLAAMRVASGQWDRVIVSAGEEYASIVRSGYESFKLGTRESNGQGPFGDQGGFVLGCGAVTLVLESRRCAEQRGAEPRGMIEKISGATYRHDNPRQAVEQVQRVIAQLDHPSHIIASANNTWLDPIEAAGIRRGSTGEPVVSSMYGHIGESSSVMPLAGIAAILLTGTLPRLHGQGLSGAGDQRLQPAKGDERPDRVGVLCTDYNGLVAAARLAAGGFRR